MAIPRPLSSITAKEPFLGLEGRRGGIESALLFMGDLAGNKPRPHIGTLRIALVAEHPAHANMGGLTIEFELLVFSVFAILLLRGSN